MSRLVLSLIGSYVIGSLPTGYLLVRWLKGFDVRTVGSGNIGATNVTRAAGAAAGVAVLLMDIAKGLLAVWVIAPWLMRPATPAGQLACGLAAVVGHTFPIFLRFQGGKGVATTIGVIVGVMPLVAAVYLGVWVIAFLARRYVSVASIAAAIVIPITQIVTHRPVTELLLGTALALLIIARHHTNIARLRQGTEPRVRRRAESGSG